MPLTLTLDLEIYLEEISYSSTLINQFKHCDGVTGIDENKSPCPHRVDGLVWLTDLTDTGTNHFIKRYK